VQVRGLIVGDGGRAFSLSVRGSSVGFGPRVRQEVRGNGTTGPAARRRSWLAVIVPDDGTLHERGGGRPAIGRMIDRFYDRVEQDELLSPFFPSGVSKQHRQHVTIWWCEVLGRPDDYTRDIGGYPPCCRATAT
jgi:hypothetical protein